MHFPSVSFTALLATFVSAIPLHLFGTYHHARDIGVQTLEENPTTAVPDWALASAGLTKRSKLITCQPDDDNGQAGLSTKGDKNWVPVDQWLTLGNEFCNDRSGLVNQIPRSQGQVFSGYATRLTNQADPTQPGDPAHIDFFVINESAGTSAAMTVDDCISALGHISAWKGSSLGQSACWGSKHNDTRGGTWGLDNGWKIGGAISPGAPLMN